MTLAWIADPADPRVKAALSRRCGICKATPDHNCHNTVRDEPLAGRIVHIERATAPDVDNEPIEKDGS